MKKIYILLMVVLFSFFLMAAPLYAFTSEGGDEVNISTDVEDDLYVFGRIITIDNKVDGDLITSGFQIDIDGEITGDLIAAGGNLKIDGDIGDDARVAGGIVFISGDIADDLIFAGGQMTINKSASIGGDLVGGGGTVEVKGEIIGDAILSGTTITISGTIEGSVRIEDVEELIITDSADIAGNIEYISAETVKIADGASIGGEVSGTIVEKDEEYTNIARTAWTIFTATYFGGKAISFLSLFVVGLILLLAVPGFFNKFNDRMRMTLGNCVGAGAIMVFGVPVAMVAVFVIMVLLFITIIGSGLGIIAISANIILAVLFMLSIYTSTIFLSFLVGRMILLKTKLDMDKYGIKVLAFLTGLIIIILLYSIPFIGWIINFAGILFGVGALSLVLKDLMLKGKKA